jgi:Tubulin-tyrosine ligase family.
MLQQLLKYYSSKHNFFEMMRFDFVIDDDLNVFVMEVINIIISYFKFPC